MKYETYTFFVEFCETDYYGHHGKWKEYLNAAHQNDQFIRQLWECCQQTPFYKGISWAAKGAAEPLVRSWNDIAVEVLDRYQHLMTDNKIDWPFNRYITVYNKV